jgi:hypothetical protein
VRLPVMDGKHNSPCVVRPGARQWDFTVQNATVRPLPCAPTKNARQSLCRAFSCLCRAPRAHGKPSGSHCVWHHVSWLTWRHVSHEGVNWTFKVVYGAPLHFIILFTVFVVIRSTPSWELLIRWICGNFGWALTS